MLARISLEEMLCELNTSHQQVRLAASPPVSSLAHREESRLGDRAGGLGPGATASPSSDSGPPSVPHSCPLWTCGKGWERGPSAVLPSQIFSPVMPLFTGTNLSRRRGWVSPWDCGTGHITPRSSAGGDWQEGHGPRSSGACQGTSLSASRPPHCPLESCRQLHEAGRSCQRQTGRGCATGWEGVRLLRDTGTSCPHRWLQPREVGFLVPAG